MNSELEKDIEEGMVCPSCAAFISFNETFCSNCNAPISLLSNVDPVQSVFAQGSFYRKTFESKPKFVVLIGTWVMFLPTFLIGFGFAIGTLIQGIGGGFGSFVVFWVMLLVGIFSFVMIYKVTRSYFRLSPRSFESD
jgi:hypothetical protein